MAGASFIIATLLNLRLVIRALPPYLILLAAFASFVMWNGGVVLGRSTGFSSFEYALSASWLTLMLRR